MRVSGQFREDAKLDVLNTGHLAQLLHGAEAEACSCISLMDYFDTCTTLGRREAVATLISHAQNEADSLLWNLIGEGRTMFDFVVRIHAAKNPVCFGRMHFVIDLTGLDSGYDGALEGQTVCVLVSIDGEVTCVKAEVRDGEIEIVLPRLNGRNDGYTQFAIVSEEVAQTLLK